MELPQIGGQRKRKVIYAPDRGELLVKMRDLQDPLHKGLPAPDGQRTTGDFLSYWVNELVLGTLSEATAQAYGHIVRRDITPTSDTSC